jgi:CheY-like chemotaxis protein
MDDIDVLIISRDNGLISQLRPHLNAWKKKHTVHSNSLDAISHLSQIPTSPENSFSRTLIVDSRNLDLDPGVLPSLIRDKLGPTDLRLLYLENPNRGEAVPDMHKQGYQEIIYPQEIIQQLFRHFEIPTSSTDGDNIVMFSSNTDEQHKDNDLKVILLAEHDNRDRIDLQKTLRNAGHKVISVGDGDQALEALEHQRFDLAIINLELPIMNGTQVIRLHRYTTPYKQQIPFIVISGDTTQNSLKICTDLHVSACLFKPALETDILDRVDACLRSKDSIAENRVE